MSSFTPNALSKFDIVWLGDTTVPWFDMLWPFSGPRMQYDESIDLEYLEPVAGFAGKTAGVVFPSGNTPEFWEEILVQKLLAKHKCEWVVLRNQAKTREVCRLIPNLQDFLDLEQEYVGPRTMDSLGREGDDTLRKVVHVLVDWGFVTSEHWPKLLEKHPSLRDLIPYLKEKRILFSDGTLPSHVISSAGELAGIAHDLPAAFHAGHGEVLESTKLRPFSNLELGGEIGKVIATKPGKHWLAREIYEKILKSKPERTTAVKTIEKNVVYKTLLIEQGRTRRKMRPISLDPDLLAGLVSQSNREKAAEDGIRINGRPVKPRD